MICPRCGDDAVDTVTTSPVPGAWDVLQCLNCLYMWRTTEPDRRSRREAYPPAFRLTRADIDNAPEVPVVPPLAMG
ncbi:non-oxidative hydroxyarylic acid decarboxylases subunit D [Streptomyces sp. NPDC051954]|uniref:non-oxidative hydroxyarylic acid decarboxylases subunit D n=1 Tax=Streptomyces sp. NPDC051954 TaxID=3155524 RepID=UPI00341AC924